MIMLVPSEKFKKVLEALQGIQNKTKTIRHFASVYRSALLFPVIEKFRALNRTHGDYEERMEIADYLKKVFSWWSNNIKADADSSAWGAVYRNKVAKGFWFSSEVKFHINYLELLAAFNGLKSFCKNHTNINILMRTGNVIAISYINRMGGIKFPAMNNIFKQIWEWCEKRRNFIFAPYINTKANVTADMASRQKSIEHDTIAFDEIKTFLGNPEIDLFASYQNKKCKNFFSWHPDPENMAVDAFTLDWSKTYYYAFPPLLFCGKY
nr:unnamed protein product [Callosobruchus chinensis]